MPRAGEPQKCCAAVLAETGLFPVSAADEAQHVDLVPEPRSASLARRFVAECAGAPKGETAEVLALLTSELVTNAILHARTPLRLGVVRHDGRVLVAVADRNLVQPEQQPYSADRTAGRGIVLIEALAERWGITKIDGGKAVWFMVVVEAA